MIPPQFTVKILKDMNPEQYRALVKRVGASNRVVRVGVPSTAKEADGVTSTALVAAVNEFGSDVNGIPERPFMRMGVRGGMNDIRRLNRINLVKIMRGQMSVTKALGQLGQFVKGLIQKEIRNGQFVPNKPATIARKGSSHPLIDKGQLVQSINYELDKER